MALITYGARVVTREELASIKAPAATDTWFPVSHEQVLKRVEAQMVEAGFPPNNVELCVARNDARFFGVLNTQSAMGSGVTLAVGVRNSTDKSLPIGFVAGHSVQVCANLAFRSEILVVRKHTRNGEIRFAEAMAKAIQKLSAFKEEETRRVTLFQKTMLTRERRDSIILEAFSEGIISSRQLPAVIYQAKTPEMDYGCDTNSAWTLLQAFTWVLADVLKANPQRFAAATMRLQHLLDQRLQIQEINPGAA